MRESGAIIISGPQGESQRATHQCCHCGNHFTVVKGSGKERGFCLACLAVTCGEKRCMEHVPFEKKLDLIESGKLSITEL